MTPLKVIHVYANYATHVTQMELFFREIETTETVCSYVLFGDVAEREKYAEIDDGTVNFRTDFQVIVNELSSQPEDIVFVFHSLFGHVQWLSILSSRLYKRSVWVVWGADLYKHVLPPQKDESIKPRIKRGIELWLKRLLAKKFLGVVALTKGDSDLVASKLWGHQENDILRYPLPGLNSLRGSEPAPCPDPQKKIRVICGNSGDATNHHKEILDLLSGYANENIELVMPLNYGATEEYINEVCAYGEQIFGNKFVALTSFMQREEYDNLLSDIDVGVFLHERQQGLYVVYSLLLQGKPFYLRANASTYEDCLQLGMSVRDSSEIPATTFRQFSCEDEETAKSNVQLSQRYFTSPYLLDDWQKYFSRLQAD